MEEIGMGDAAKTARPNQPAVVTGRRFIRRSLAFPNAALSNEER
jgi:hypothetical protein